MRIRSISSKPGSPGKILLGLLAFLCLITLAACGSSNSVEIFDNARVLNNSRVQRAANGLSNPIAIYTTSTFQGNHADFQRTAVRRLNGNPDLIVMAIDTTHRYVYIARGSNVSISGSGVNQAVSAFSSNFGDGNYTAASTAAIDSLRKSSKASSTNTGGLFSNPLTLLCCIVPLLLILFLALFGMSRRNRPGGFGQNRGFFGRSPFNRGDQPGREPYNQEPYNQGPYNQGPYNQGPYNQGPYAQGPYNQGPYYGGPQQGGGMNPWAAGGLGAAAGGLAGYALGRREGEHHDDKDGGQGGGGDFGGDNYANGGEQGGGGSFGGGSGLEDAGSEQGRGGNFGGNFGNDDFSGGEGGFGSGGSFGGGDPGGGDFGGNIGGDGFDSENSGGGGNF